MAQTKAEWITIFREKANRNERVLASLGTVFRDKAAEANKCISTLKTDLIGNIVRQARTESWPQEVLLKQILLITYSSYVVMLEFRNKYWPYEYMAFSRRIGELWEPFCKLTFEYPITNLVLISPPDFNDVQNALKQDAAAYINSLSLSQSIKEELMRHFSVPWHFIDSGGIKLSLDLHFCKDGINYNCDLKSGFSSNEKGNTNRLLLVASIYHSISDIEKTIIFVRQREDENNHYLRTLITSGYWDVYCSDDAYRKMHELSGFNLRTWINDNVAWEDDFEHSFREYLAREDLLKYLTW